jgi:hypothetical protein
MNVMREEMHILYPDGSSQLTRKMLVIDNLTDIKVKCYHDDCSDMVNTFVETMESETIIIDNEPQRRTYVCREHCKPLCDLAYDEKHSPLGRLLYGKH